MDNSEKDWRGHACMLMAGIIWGLMAPIGKAAMANGITGLDMVLFRTAGAAVCFWITSLFVQREKVERRDMIMFFFAAMLSIVCNQCCFIVGLSKTSPINASIVTTTMPIFTLILSAIFMKEPITGKKILGVGLGVVGALILIIGSSSATTSDGNLTGDILCLLAQLSFASYLAIFRKLISKYTVITCMKWMFLYATIVALPISYGNISQLDWASIGIATWAECFYVVFAATFISYILMMKGQKSLRPTVVSMYNYVQPTVSCMVSAAVGLGIFGWSQAIAIVAVFSGVWLVTQSKSRQQIEEERKKK